MKLHLECIILLSLILISACQSNPKTLKPIRQSITESIYASGVIVSKNQYQVFPTVSGIVDRIFVDEGAQVEIGSPILSIRNDAQKISADNAKLTVEFNALNLNRGKIDEAKSFVNLTKNQLDINEINLERQRNLWSQGIGSKSELEQRELAFKNSQNNYTSAKEKLQELNRQQEYQSK